MKKIRITLTLILLLTGCQLSSDLKDPQASSNQVMIHIHFDNTEKVFTTGGLTWYRNGTLINSEAGGPADGSALDNVFTSILHKDETAWLSSPTPMVFEFHLYEDIHKEPVVTVVNQEMIYELGHTYSFELIKNPDDTYSLVTYHP